MADAAFDEWRPDLADLLNKSLTVCRNTRPGSGGYIPQPSLVSVSSALDGRALAGIGALKSDGTAVTYVGDSTKLYALSGATFSNVSKSGNYTLSADERWSLLQWDDQIIASSWDEPIQVITISAANFADMITSTRKPKARHMGIVKDHLVLGNVTDTTDGDQTHRVWWSATTDITDFDPAIATGSGIQDLDINGGEVVAVIGGEFGSIFQRSAIWRMSFEGPPTLFRFDKVVRNRGALSAGSVAAFNRVTFFIDRDGFYIFDGSDVTPIGKDRVDRFFSNDVDASNLWQITSAIEPENSIVSWSYKSNDSPGNYPDKIIQYNWSTARWSISEIDHQLIFPNVSNSQTLDDATFGATTLDSDMRALDADEFKGGLNLLAGFDTSNQMASFSGAAMDARFETGEFQEFPGQRTHVGTIRPLVDGTASTVSVSAGVRELQTESVTYTTPTTVNANGEAELRKSARYMRLRVDVTGGFNDALGARYEPKPLGKR